MKPAFAPFLSPVRTGLAPALFLLAGMLSACQGYYKEGLEGRVPAMDMGSHAPCETDKDCVPWSYCFEKQCIGRRELLCKADTDCPKGLVCGISQWCTPQKNVPAECPLAADQSGCRDSKGCRDPNKCPAGTACYGPRCIRLDAITCKPGKSECPKGMCCNELTQLCTANVEECQCLETRDNCPFMYCCDRSRNRCTKDADKCECGDGKGCVGGTMCCSRESKKCSYEGDKCEKAPQTSREEGENILQQLRDQLKALKNLDQPGGADAGPGGDAGRDGDGSSSGEDSGRTGADRAP
ncbi:MAG: hypothetical protein GMKNLPBB_03415 [Myxococcota bacterium]|nr:hypothetical protein [Myxococcota bacterium]